MCGFTDAAHTPISYLKNIISSLKGEENVERHTDQIRAEMDVDVRVTDNRVRLRRKLNLRAGQRESTNDHSATDTTTSNV